MCHSVTLSPWFSLSLLEGGGDLGVRGHEGHVAVGSDGDVGGQHLGSERYELVGGHGPDLRRHLQKGKKMFSNFSALVCSNVNIHI
jgi:hypothetical protein